MRRQTLHEESLEVAIFVPRRILAISKLPTAAKSILVLVVSVDILNPSFVFPAELALLWVTLHSPSVHRPGNVFIVHPTPNAHLSLRLPLLLGQHALLHILTRLLA